MKMISIYTALLSEAQAIIEKHKLAKINSNPKIYSNRSIILLIGGIGETNLSKNLTYLFHNYSISKAINIGIAGCSDETVKIGEIFCVNKKLDGIKKMICHTVDVVQVKKFPYQEKSLYDMEAKYFIDICDRYIDSKDIYVFKVVSDHLDDKILPKDTVKKLIQNSLTQWEQFI